MTLPVDFPNAEVLLIDYLDGQVGAPVANAVPDPRPGEFVVVRRQGGIALNPVADGPLMTIESWAATDTAAEARIQLVRRKLHELQGTTLAGVPVYRVNEVGGPGNLPDPDSEQPRYTMLMQLMFRGS
jgi:hypothetical protein